MATPSGMDLTALSQLHADANLNTTDPLTYQGLVFALLSLRRSQASPTTQANAIKQWTAALPLFLAPAEVGKALLTLEDRTVPAMIFKAWSHTRNPPGSRLSNPAVADAWRQVITNRATRTIVYPDISPTMWSCALATQGGYGRYAKIVQQLANKRRAWAHNNNPVRDGASHMVTRVSGKYESMHFGLNSSWMDAVVFSSVCEDRLTLELLASLQLAAACYKWKSTRITVSNLLLRCVWRRSRPGMAATSRLWLAAAAHAAVFGDKPLQHNSTLAADCGYFTGGHGRKSTLLAEFTRIDMPTPLPCRRMRPLPGPTERAMRALRSPHILPHAVFPFLRVCCDRFAGMYGASCLPNELVDLIASFFFPAPLLWSDYVLSLPVSNI